MLSDYEASRDDDSKSMPTIISIHEIRAGFNGNQADSDCNGNGRRRWISLRLRVPMIVRLSLGKDEPNARNQYILYIRKIFT